MGITRIDNPASASVPQSNSTVRSGLQKSVELLTSGLRFQSTGDDTVSLNANKHHPDSSESINAAMAKSWAATHQKKEALTGEIEIRNPEDWPPSTSGVSDSPQLSQAGMSVASENLLASKARIEDAGMAAEVSRNTLNHVVSRSNVSVQTQANFIGHVFYELLD